MQPTFNQLQLADRKLFQLLAEKTRSGIQATPSGRPVDEVFENTWMAPEVLHILQPMPRPTGQAAHPPKETRPLPPDHWVPSRKGKGKGKTKQRASVRLPAGLEGCRSHTHAGEPICFGYGLKDVSRTSVEGKVQQGPSHMRLAEVWEKPAGS